MPFVEQIMRGILPPLAVAVPLLLLGWWRRTATARWREATAALALGGGWFAAHTALAGLPPLPGVTSTHWLLHGTSLATVVAMLDARRALSRSLWLGAHGVLAVLTSWLILRRLCGEWSPGESIGQVAAVAATMLVLAAGLAPAAAPRCRLLPPVVLLAVCTGAAQVLMAAGSALFAQLAGALAAVAGACCAAAVRNPAFRIGRGGVLVLAIALGGLLQNGHHFAELPITALVCVALAPAMLWIDRLLGGAPPLLRWIAVLGGVAALMGIAGAMAPGSGGYGY